jgi:hypothetical protein
MGSADRRSDCKRRDSFMICIDPGHRYLVKGFDSSISQVIEFMKRIGEGYPGNDPPAYGGTNCQELLRVVIDRVEYLNKQKESNYNRHILDALRNVLLMFEERAAEMHGMDDVLTKRISAEPGFVKNIEKVSVCNVCGHLVCHGHDGAVTT